MKLSPTHTIAAILAEIESRNGRCEARYGSETCVTQGLALRDTCEFCLLDIAACFLHESVSTVPQEETALLAEIAEKLAKVTRGEWSAIGGGNSVGVYTDIQDGIPISAPIHVASCWVSERVPKIDGYANAVLMAAAPRLLASAARLLRHCRRQRETISA